MGEKNRPLLGALVAVAAYIPMALIGAFTTALPEGFPVMEIFFFQCVLPLLVAVLLTARRGFRTTHPWLHCTRSVSGLLAFAGYLLAARLIPLVDATLFITTSPLWIPFVILVWKRERIYRHIWWGIVIGFAGVLLVLHPDRGVFHWASLIGLSTGLTLGIGYVAVSLLSSTEPNSRIVFYFMLLCTLFAIPFTIVQWMTPTFVEWWLLLGIGLSMTANQYLINWALSLARPSVIGPLAFSAPVFAGVIGWTVWHEVPTWLTLIGMALVIIGGTACILAGQKSRTVH